jgi:hypothetical protein
MVSGVPITFTGSAFGNIAPGANYYVGNITSVNTITITTLPGGATWPVANATGNMTATFTGAGQEIINTGSVPNDGTGSPIRTAFTDTNVNFDQVFAAGPVGSNIRIVNNTILTTNTNGNLVLNPNGIGAVVANAHVLPDQTNIRNLGSQARRFATVYAQYLDVNQFTNLTISTANLHITGGSNGYVLQTDGTGNLTWTAQTGGTGNGTPGGANTQVQFNDAGTFGGQAGFTFDKTSNVLSVPGNLTLPNNGDTSIGTEFNTNPPGHTLSLKYNGGVSGGSGGELRFDYGTAEIKVVKDAGTTQTWTFAADGQINIPEGSNSFDNGRIQSANGYPTLLGYGSGGHGGPELDWMDSDDPANAFGNSTVLRNTMYINDGGLYVGMNENDVANVAVASWRFAPDGGTIFPTLNVARGDNPSGNITGQTLLFGNPNQEAIISTPDGTPGNEYSQRLVINPGAGNDFGEGGDIYLWAGRGGDNNGSGGDVKIRGGQGMGEAGSGGYLRIEAGDSQDRGAPGYIDITGGYGANTYGGYVQVTGGGGGNGQGGPVQILGGYGAPGFKGGDANIIGGSSADGASNYGNVNINSGGQAWSFRNNGTTQFPNNTINPGNNQDLTIRTQSSGNAYTLTYQDSNSWETYAEDDETGPNTAWAWIYAELPTIDTPQVFIENKTGSDGISKRWTFDAAGNLTVPGNIIIPAGANTHSVIRQNQNPPIGSEPFGIELSTISDTPGIYSSVSAGPDYVTLNSSNGGNANVVLQGGYGVTVSTTDVDGNNEQDWTFGTDGSLTFPSGAGFVKGDSGQLKTNDGTTVALDFRDTSGRGFYTNGDGYTLRSNGSNNWIFGIDGNLTLPGNTSSINYANGDPYGGGENYGNANVATFLADFGSNNVSTAGNVTAGTGLFGEIYLDAVGTNKLLYSDGNRYIYDTTFSYDSDNNIISGSGAVSITGNISGAYLFGNGSQLTGLSSTYGDSNVTTLLSDFGSNNVSTTGSVTAGEFDVGANLYIGPGPGGGTFLLANVDTSLATLSQGANGQAFFGWTEVLLSDTGNIAALTFNPNGSGQGNMVVSTGPIISQYNWTFDNTGNLNLPQGGWIGDAGVKGGGTMLTGGPGNLTSVTSYYADTDFYSTCLTANPDGNLNITTYGNGSGQLGQWTFSSANLLLASQNVSGNVGESALLAGTRKIVNGQYSGTAYGYSAELAAGGTPSVAYTASNEYVQSVRLTFAVESVGTAPQWEQFDVVATKSLDTPGSVNFVVSNRIKARASIADTVVTATINLANEIEISLNLDAAQTTGGWSSFDAVEFGVMFN